MRTQQESDIYQEEMTQKKQILLANLSLISSIQNFEEINFRHLSHSICSTLLWQPEPTNPPVTIDPKLSMDVKVLLIDIILPCKL